MRSLIFIKNIYLSLIEYVTDFLFLIKYLSSKKKKIIVFKTKMF